MKMARQWDNEDSEQISIMRSIMFTLRKLDVITSRQFKIVEQDMYEPFCEYCECHKDHCECRTLRGFYERDWD